MKKIYLLCLLGLFLSSPAVAEDEDIALPGLAVGVEAPDFEAITHQGEIVRLSTAIEDGPVVLVFYRGGWCMYCNMQLWQFLSFPFFIIIEKPCSGVVC